METRPKVTRPEAMLSTWAKSRLNKRRGRDACAPCTFVRREPPVLHEAVSQVPILRFRLTAGAQGYPRQSVCSSPAARDDGFPEIPVWHVERDSGKKVPKKSDSEWRLPWRKGRAKV